MAIVLKEGKTFNPSISAQYGVDMTGADFYGVIDIIECNKKERNCMFMVEVYGNKALRDGDGAIVDRINFVYRGAEFVNKISNNSITIPQAYSLALETLTDWESDEV